MIPIAICKTIQRPPGGANPGRKRIMNVYRVTDQPSSADHFVSLLRRQGYTAYLEQDGDNILLITDYIAVGYGFQYIGRR